jgi:hypothetical protein
MMSLGHTTPMGANAPIRRIKGNSPIRIQMATGMGRPGISRNQPDAKPWGAGYVE